MTRSRLNHTIRRARRRRALNDTLAGAGRGFAIGAAAALLLVLATRLLGYDAVPAVYLAIVAAGVMAGAIRAGLDTPGGFDIALHLDRAMHLRDRLATAYALDGRPGTRANGALRHDEAFASLVQREGERLADSIDIRALAPIQLTGGWSAGAVLTILLTLAVVYMPVRAWGERGPDSAMAAAEEEADEERERLRVSLDEIMADLREDDIDDPRAREEIEALERLAEQLAAPGNGDPAELRRARDESAARLNELADRLAEQARRDAEAAEQLARRFSGLEAPERPMSAAEFDEALKRGDFGAAADRLDEQLDRAAEMAERERRELAEHLRRTAEQVDHLAGEGDPELTEREAQLEQMLREHGINEDRLRDLLHGDEDSTREAMERLNELLADDDAARRLERELERLRDDRELQEQLRRDLDAINEAMRDAAQQLDPEPDPEIDPQRDPQPEQPPEARDEQPDVREPGDPGDPTEPGEPGEPGVEEVPGQEPAPGDEPSPDAQPQERPAEPGEEPDAEREAVQEGAPGDEEQEGVGESPSPDETAQEGEAIGEQPDEAQAQEQRRTPSDAMREIERRRRDAERRGDAAERTRQRARELADSPQRDTLRELQRQLARDPAADPSAGLEPGERPRPVDAARAPDAETEDVDARVLDDDPGEVIAEWFSDEEVAGDPEVRRTQAQERMRQAQRVAERAVEEAAVPARYHEFIRRYFGRFADPPEGGE